MFLNNIVKISEIVGICCAPTHKFVPTVSSPVRGHNPTVVSTSLEKTFFAWRSVLNENVLFSLTISIRNHLSFLFLRFVAKHLLKNYFYVQKIGLTYVISTVSWIF